ncbi:MAG: response regulator [Haloarculaceae archaeon]
MEDPLTVLVADDDPGVRKRYSCWLEDQDLRLAADGREALERVDGAVDVACLDHEMGGPSGVGLAADLTARVGQVHVALVSSLPEDPDLADLPVDQHVRRPVTRADVREVLETCRARRRCLNALDEYFALTARLGAAEATGAGVDGDLRRRVAEKRAEVDKAVRDVGTDWPALFDRLETSTRNPEAEPRRTRDRERSRP